MEIIKPRTLSGFMELLPGKQIQFERMAQILRTTYASYGFGSMVLQINLFLRLRWAKNSFRHWNSFPL